MPPKRTIKAKEIVNDIRARMTDAELMAKYSLSAKGLESIFKKLLKVKAVTRKELYGRFPFLDDTVNLDNVRKIPRNFPAFPLPIYETANMHVEGSVRDITEKGLQVSGIEARPEETKEFVIRADEFQDIYPIVFQAVCRWTTNGAGTNGSVAGFEITDLSAEGTREIRNLIRSLTLRE